MFVFVARSLVEIPRKCFVHKPFSNFCQYIFNIIYVNTFAYVNTFLYLCR